MLHDQKCRMVGHSHTWHSRWVPHYLYMELGTGYPLVAQELFPKELYHTPLGAMFLYHWYNCYE